MLSGKAKKQILAGQRVNEAVNFMGIGDNVEKSRSAALTKASNLSIYENQQGTELANLPPNLQQLAFTRHVLIRITQSFDNALLFKGNQNYEIFNTFGSRMYCASVPIMKLHQQRTEFYIQNPLGQPCLKMEVYIGCCGRGAGLTVSLPDDRLVGTICQESRSCFLEYFILDTQRPATTILKIKGPKREYLCFGGLGKVEDFAIFSASDSFLGRISQHWDTLGENFVREDDSSFRTYGSALPIEMSANVKSLIMGLLILLDLQFWPPLQTRIDLLNDKNYSVHVIVIILGLLVSILITTLVILYKLGVRMYL